MALAIEKHLLDIPAIIIFFFYGNIKAVLLKYPRVGAVAALPLASVNLYYISELNTTAATNIASLHNACLIVAYVTYVVANVLTRDGNRGLSAVAFTVPVFALLMMALGYLLAHIRVLWLQKEISWLLVLIIVLADILLSAEPNAESLPYYNYVPHTYPLIMTLTLVGADYYYIKKK